MIPFALAQRNSNNRGGHAALAPSAPTKNVAPVASDYLKLPTAPSSVRFSLETQHLAKKLLARWPMVTGQTGARAIPVPANPKRPAGISCTWSIVANYPETLESPAVCSNGTLAYSAGGRGPTAGFYSYDPVADSWSTLAPLPQPLYDARSTYAANVNKVYVFGGLDPSNNTLNTTYIYDIASNTWTTGAPMPETRFFPGVNYYTGNGKIYVIGGFLDVFSSDANQTWEYDPVADTWDTSRTPIPVGMGGSATSIVGQNIYLQGSFGGSGATDLNYRYDIGADSWTQMAPMPRAKYEAVGAAIGTRTYVVGGGNPSLGPQASAEDRKLASIMAPATSFKTTFIYDTTTDTWFTGPDTNVRHSFTGGTAIGDLLIVVGGFDGSSDTNTVEKGELVACTPTPTPTPCTPTPPPGFCGLTVGSGLTTGFPFSDWSAQVASNTVNYTFAQSVPASNEFAIFENHDPWGATVIKDAITAAGHTYAVFTPCDLIGFDFSQYRVVILNWDDTFVGAFLDSYSEALPALEAYSAAGGVVWVQGAIQSFFGECYPLPFGGQACGDIFGSEDPIADRCSPMMTGVSDPLMGNSASHVSQTGLPVDAHVVVLSDADNNPVLYDLACQTASPTPTPTPPRCNTGLIHNSGFETGNFADWTIDGTIPSPEALNVLPHSGRFSASLGGNPSASL